LLGEFRKLFEGRVYNHRDSSQGDFVAMHLFEDLVAISRSARLVNEIQSGVLVLNMANRLQGVRARRGDGTLGQILPGESPIRDKGYEVARGRIATVEIGVEVKILAKAMIKQVDRVINDLKNQVVQFRQTNQYALCVGVVGINQADHYVSYEGRDRSYPTTGRGGYLHPNQEAAEAERRLHEHAAPAYNELLVLRFKATNEKPYPFEWVEFEELQRNYAAALTRVSSAFQQRM
jgi:hypothetical protein